MKKSIVIITGGPGFGKSSVVRKLSEYHYKVGSEFAREIIEEQTMSGGDKLPWKNIKRFQEEVFRRRLEFYNAVKENELAFSDRGIPDQLAFARYRGVESDSLLKAAQKYRYFPSVFTTSPWNEIFEKDSVRSETIEEASRLHEVICKTYIELKYELVELPKLDVKTRAEFIINYITNRNNELIKKEFF